MVSIVVPVYNAQEYIARTLDSFISQSLQDWEVIIVDDGSTDNSSQIIKEYTQKDTRFKYYKQTNAGVSVARNTGIKKASGQFISFCDSDDTWYPHNLERRIHFLEENKLDWCFSNLTLINENDIEIDTLKVQPTNLLEDVLSWNGNSITTPSTITVRKKVVDKVKFDPKFSTAADQDFFIQIAANYKGGFIDEELVYYRVLPNSMSRNIAVMEKDHIGVFSKAKANKLFKTNNFQKQCFANLYFIIGASWWKNGGSKTKGIKFLVKSFFTSPSFFFNRIRK